MTYRYTKSAIFLQGLAVALFAFLAVYGMNWLFQFFCAFFGFMLLKDLAHCVYAVFQLDETGLLEQSRFKTRYRMRWDNLRIVSKTMVNRRWIMLRGEDRQYYMIRPHISNYEGLARDIILYMKEHRIKGVAIHEDLLKRLYITDVKLNSEGYIKFDR